MAWEVFGLLGNQLLMFAFSCIYADIQLFTPKKRGITHLFKKWIYPSIYQRINFAQDNAG
jgi:hypothetical protein